MGSAARFCPACGSAQIDDVSPPEFHSGDRVERSVLRSLVDLRFEVFVTPSILGFIYALLIFLVVIGYLVTVASGFGESSAAGLLALILGPFVGLFWILLIRVGLELSVARIKTAEHTAKTAELLANRSTP